MITQPAESKKSLRRVCHDRIARSTHLTDLQCHIELGTAGVELLESLINGRGGGGDVGNECCGIMSCVRICDSVTLGSACIRDLPSSSTQSASKDGMNAVITLLMLPIAALARPAATPTFVARDAEPTWPASPPSCYICEASYPEINSCAQAAVIFANVSLILYNPASFITTIECACTDTFQSAYPQCVDCFEQTNQTDFLNANMDQIPSIVQGIRQICALGSTLFGGVVATNGEQVGGTPTVVPSPTAVNSAPILLPGASQLWLGILACLVAGIGIMFT